MAPDAEHLAKRVKEIWDGNYEQAMKDLMSKSDEELKALYDQRDIEK